MHEDALTSSLQLALDHIDRGIVVLDHQARIVAWNQWLAQHTRISAQQALGQTLVALFPKGLNKTLEQAIEAALTHGQASQLPSDEHPIDHSSGEQVNTTIRAILSPLDRTELWNEPDHVDPTEQPTSNRAANNQAQSPAQINDPLKQWLPLHRSPQTSSLEPMPHAVTVTPIAREDETYDCLLQIIDPVISQADQTSRQHAQQKIDNMAETMQRQEIFASTISENIADAVIAIDSQHRVVCLNRSARELFRLADSSIIGQDVRLLLDIDRCDNQAENKISCQLTGRRGDGQQFPIEVCLTQVPMQKEPQTLVIVQDLSIRRQIEENLFREKEFAQTTLQAIHEAVITTDAKGRINSANKAACELLKREHALVIERPLLDLLTFSSLDHRRAARAGLRDALEIGQTWEMADQPELRFSDGETIYVSGRFNALRSTDGHIIGSVVVLEDVTIAKRMQEILAYQASHDELTNLINRREFERMLNELLDKREADTQDILLYLDLDQFKLINDNCGHDAGDQLLKQLTGLLATRLRHTDTLARLGGDEFAVLLPSCGTEVGLRIAEELRETVTDYRFNWKGRNFALGVSIGLVSINSSMDNTATVLAAADSACYIAKENGRDQVVVYKPDGNEEQRRREEMSQAARIRESLEHQRFALYCQPIVPVDWQQTSDWGVEILVRMLNDEQKALSPMAFIPAAERYNLMSHIDRWVIDALSHEWHQNPALFDRLEKIAINLSGQSIANEEFLAYLIDLFEGKDLPWQKVCFEITETAAVASIERAQHFIQVLSDKGCRFALDDFGSGLSSFTYLKHLPVDYLKIDGSFVKDMLSDEIDAAMVRSISDIGRSMGLKTIAEFVEDEKVLQALSNACVDYAQGYGICKPMPLHQLHEFDPHRGSSAKRGD